MPTVEPRPAGRDPRRPDETRPRRSSRPRKRRPEQPAASNRSNSRPRRNSRREDASARSLRSGTPPAEGEAAETEEEQPAEEAAEAPPEPDNTQPAAPIPQGGIRIVFPTEFNDVPIEANARSTIWRRRCWPTRTCASRSSAMPAAPRTPRARPGASRWQRCINIRQYLFKKDVRTTRMDVRALGLKSEGQPADRVDIVPANS